MKGGFCDLQSIYSSARKLLSAAQTIGRTMSEPLCVRLSAFSYLVFNYGISKVICKIAHGGHVPFVLHIFGGSGAFG